MTHPDRRRRGREIRKERRRNRDLVASWAALGAAAERATRAFRRFGEVVKGVQR